MKTWKIIGIAVLLGAVAVGVVVREGIGERRTPIRIEATGASDGVHLVLSYCDGRDEAPALHLVEMVRSQAERHAQECLMVQETGRDRALSHWRVGEHVQGFYVEGCDVLSAGEYRVAVLGAGRFGWAAFRLAADGSVERIARTCH